MGFIQEFKDFAFKGNLLDMAVGLVMGTAVAAMTKSFIDHIIMPLVASVLKVGDLSAYTIPIGTTIEKEVDGKMVTESAQIYIGSFIQEVMNFVILAFVIFLALKVAARWMKKTEAAKPPAADIVLLTEIRDALKK
ncbi:MAG: large conductance mechanosensitive channel [Mariniblastus sp.]|jgi:large conductance mechanosensitive channel